MATNIIVYARDLPYQPRRKLCRILDGDRRWKELGSIHMGFDEATMYRIQCALCHEMSPTAVLLNKFSANQGTICQLFKMLVEMDHQECMAVLMPFVESKYHCPLRPPSAKKEPEKQYLYSTLPEHSGVRFEVPFIPPRPNKIPEKDFLPEHVKLPFSD